MLKITTTLFMRKITTCLVEHPNGADDSPLYVSSALVCHCRWADDASPILSVLCILRGQWTIFLHPPAYPPSHCGGPEDKTGRCNTFLFFFISSIYITTFLLHFTPFTPLSFSSYFSLFLFYYHCNFFLIN